MRRFFESVFAIAPQLSRYTVVSALALALDLAFYLGLIQVGLRASVAGVAGYLVGLALHYALTTRFVFDASRTEKSDTRLVAEFAASGAIGVLITVGIIDFATVVLALHPLVAKGIAVSASFLAVYALRKTIVFAERAPALEARR
ncbi:MAG: GtrA family protein [Hyphomicrobium sp.]